MPRSKSHPSLTIFLGLLSIGAVVVAYTSVGSASQTSTQSRRTATVAKGVVQSTVSGSGNLEASSELDLGFKTAGVVDHVYAKQGQHVVTGQLLASLDPESAEVTLEQAKASLKSAQASLAQEEEDNGESSSAGSGQDTSSSSSSSSSAGVTTATREANLASAKAAVRSDELTVEGDEQAVQNTNLYAPHDGTIVTLSGEVGETVSATGTTNASSSSASSSSESSNASTAAGTSSSGSSFAVLSDLASMKLVVSLSESEIGEVKDGQPATVSVEALSGAKLAAHVTEVSSLSTSSSDAVSYDVTFRLDQMRSGLKPGMSATAEVVIKQAEGLNVPTSAISGSTVTVERDGKEVSEAVTKGLAGDTSTIILTGLKAGETVVLPEASATSSTAAAAKSGTGTGSGTLGTGAAGGLGASGGGFPAGGAPGGGGPP
jgi:macrolide-specific efflux system membrane fusion protein